MTIFVGGVHGAGKTFLTNSACERLGLRHATASQLIREERGLAAWTQSKVVADVQENQRALVQAIARVKASNVQLVLDGHFALRRGPWDHILIEASVFRDLGVRAVLLVQCPASVVWERLKARGDASWDMAEVQGLIEQEHHQAALVASELDVSMRVLDAPTPEYFEASLKVFVSG